MSSSRPLPLPSSSTFALQLPRIVRIPGLRHHHLLLLVLLISLSLFRPASGIKCLSCRTMAEAEEGQQLNSCAADPCEGDICVLWKYREMSTDLILQGCISGPDLRSSAASSRLRMGCRSNGVGALLCLCRDRPLCNSEENTAPGHSVQPMLPTDIRCNSRTWASFISRQMVQPPRHSCRSDFCFLTETNKSRPSLGDSLGRSPRTESTSSRSCGPQAEFNFDLLLGPLWPGNGLHAEACYLLEGRRESVLGCSCSNNDCNRDVPYPIDPQRKRVKCHFGEEVPGASSPFSNNSTQFCQGQFCFVQRMPVQEYGDRWLSGCLSANESAAGSKLKAGYRNILGVEQWLCKEDFCNLGREWKETSPPGITPTPPIVSSSSSGHGSVLVVVDAARGTTRIWASMRLAEGGRVQAHNQAAGNRKWRPRENRGRSVLMRGAGGGGPLYWTLLALCLFACHCTQRHRRTVQWNK